MSELAAPLDVSLPTVLQHLDVLQQSGLVRSEKVGRVRTCRLEPDPMRAVEEARPYRELLPLPWPEQVT